MAEQTIPAAIQPEDQLRGINGWLLLLVIKLCISTAVRALAGLAEPPSTVAVFNLFSAAFSGLAVLLLVKRNRKAVIITKVFLGFNAIYYLIAIADGLMSNNNVIRPVGFLAASLIWLVYLARSRRVQNTYGDLRREAIDPASFPRGNNPTSVQRATSEPAPVQQLCEEKNSHPRHDEPESERTKLQVLAERISTVALLDFEAAKSCDKELRTLLRTTEDDSIRHEAYMMWNSLWQSWIAIFYAKGSLDTSAKLKKAVEEFRIEYIQLRKAFDGLEEISHLMDGCGETGKTEEIPLDLRTSAAESPQSQRVYEPTHRDLDWAKTTIDRLIDGGLLHYPSADLLYRVFHTRHELLLLNPERLAIQDSQSTHLKTIEVFKDIGFVVLLPDEPEDECLRAANSDAISQSYKPNPGEVATTRRALAALVDGGQLQFPLTNLIYRIFHSKKEFVLQNPKELISAASLIRHLKNVKVLNEIGYRLIQMC